MQRVLYTLLISLSFSLFTSVLAQDTVTQPAMVFDSTIIKNEYKMEELGKTMLGDSLLVNRLSANSKLVSLFEETLSLENAYSYPFDSLLSVSKLESEDGSFKVFTWQLYEKEDVYTYMGYILKADGTLINLKDRSSDYFTPEFENGDKDHWYGALYYNMIPFQSEDSTSMYLMFGYDGNSLMEKRKIIDVLSFDQDGNPQFGAPVFIAGEDSKAHPPILQRVILEYFAGASVKCNYDEMQDQILYEHLIFRKTPMGEYLIPDGSYEGYVYAEGKWKHNAKVFHQTQDEPPFPEPKKEEKDIFGKEYKRATVNPNRSKSANKGVRERNAKLRKEKEKEKAQENN